MNAKMTGLIMFIIGVILTGVSGAVLIATENTSDAAVVAVIGGILIALGVLSILTRKEAGQIPEHVEREFVCPNCGALVPIDVDRCPDCRKSFLEGKFECPKCHTSVDVYETSCPKCGFLFVEMEYGICPSCRAHIPLNSKKCPECGEKIWSALKPPKKIMACPSCHKPVSADADACPFCGFRLKD